MADTRIKVVTIMNYPPDPRFRRMCHAFLDSVIAHGAASVTILYEDEPPVVAAEHARAADIEIVQRRSVDVGHPHFNLRFKLAEPRGARLSRSSTSMPIRSCSATSTISGAGDTTSRGSGSITSGSPPIRGPTATPFLNSGVQLVSDPAFYDLDAILAVQNAAAPLSRAAEFTKDEMFASPGTDQAVLYRYFRSIGYDYTHPEIGPEWNSCAGITEVQREGEEWKARTRGLRRGSRCEADPLLVPVSNRGPSGARSTRHYA